MEATDLIHHHTAGDPLLEPNDRELELLTRKHRFSFRSNTNEQLLTDGMLKSLHIYTNVQGLGSGDCITAVESLLRIKAEFI